MAWREYQDQELFSLLLNHLETELRSIFTSSL